jgi:hypothetical protein
MPAPLCSRLVAICNLVICNFKPWGWVDPAFRQRADMLGRHWTFVRAMTPREPVLSVAKDLPRDASATSERTGAGDSGTAGVIHHQLRAIIAQVEFLCLSG